MTSLPKPFLDIVNLFFPNLCPGCASILNDYESIICDSCRTSLTFFHYNAKNNPIHEKLVGRIPVRQAYALYRFDANGKLRTIIHSLKYKRKEAISAYFGLQMSAKLGRPELYDFDFVIPVPLHLKKQKKRGFNQITGFGKCLANHLRIPFHEDRLKRIANTKSQTKKLRFDRWKNVQGKFQYTGTSINGKHVLLVDDVMTTGATLEICAQVLLKEGAEISIALIAVAL